MTVLSDYVSRMVESGMDPDEAMQIAAEIFAAGAACAAVRPSSGAIRTRKWRAKQPSPSVTSDAPRHEDDSVTNRHQASQVTECDNAPLSKSKDIKIDSTKRERRATQLPEGWKPDEQRWASAIQSLGEDGATRELRKFTNHALEKGRVAKNWNAAWDNWVDRAVEWGANRQKPPPNVEPRATTVHQQRQQESRNVLDQMREFNTRTGGGTDLGVLRLDPGDEPSGVRSGTGGNLVQLPASGHRSRG